MDNLKFSTDQNLLKKIIVKKLTDKFLLFVENICQKFIMESFREKLLIFP